MGGFFFIGPFGLVAGFLMVFGAVLLFSEGGNAALGKWTMGGGGAVLALGGLVVCFILASNGSGSGQVSDYNFRFEVKVPNGVDAGKLRWNYLGEAIGNSRTAPAMSPFWDQKCDEEACVVSGAVQMIDNPQSRSVVVEMVEGWRQVFAVPIGGRVQWTTDWSEWQTGEREVKFRWRMEAVERGRRR